MGPTPTRSTWSLNTALISEWPERVAFMARGSTLRTSLARVPVAQIGGWIRQKQLVADLVWFHWMSPSILRLSSHIIAHWNSLARIRTSLRGLNPAKVDCLTVLAHFGYVDLMKQRWLFLIRPGRVLHGTAEPGFWWHQRPALFMVVRYFPRAAGRRVLPKKRLQMFAMKLPHTYFSHLDFTATHLKSAHVESALSVSISPSVSLPLSLALALSLSLSFSLWVFPSSSPFLCSLTFYTMRSSHHFAGTILYMSV